MLHRRRILWMNHVVELENTVAASIGRADTHVMRRGGSRHLDDAPFGVCHRLIAGRNGNGDARHPALDILLEPGMVVALGDVRLASGGVQRLVEIGDVVGEETHRVGGFRARPPLSELLRGLVEEFADPHDRVVSRAAVDVIHMVHEILDDHVGVGRALHHQILVRAEPLLKRRRQE